MCSCLKHCRRHKPVVEQVHLYHFLLQNQVGILYFEEIGLSKRGEFRNWNIAVIIQLLCAQFAAVISPRIFANEPASCESACKLHADRQTGGRGRGGHFHAKCLQIAVVDVSKADHMFCERRVHSISSNQIQVAFTIVFSDFTMSSIDDVLHLELTVLNSLCATHVLKPFGVHF